MEHYKTWVFFITKYGDIDFHRVPILIDDKDFDKIYLTKFLLVKGF